MRIIGGKFRGTALASIGSGDKAAHLRPTSDRVRESIFNLLLNGGYGDVIDGVRVLDLFAGTGALGLEALSRNAETVLFVDDGAKSRSVLRQNIQLLRVNEVAKMMRRDAVKLGKNDGLPFDLVFLDPPYGKGLGEKALESAAAGGWIKTGGLCVWEENSEKLAPTGYVMLDVRKYGDTYVHVLRLKDD